MERNWLIPSITPDDLVQLLCIGCSQLTFLGTARNCWPFWRCSNEPLVMESPEIKNYNVYPCCYMTDGLAGSMNHSTYMHSSSNELYFWNFFSRKCNCLTKHASTRYSVCVHTPLQFWDPNLKKYDLMLKCHQNVW